MRRDHSTPLGVWATPECWKRLRRFLKWQLDRDHNLETMRAVEGLRRFDHPALLLWGRHDTNFAPAIAERLARDIPGVAVDQGEDVSVIAKFDGCRGRYLLHCHNLEHEAHSMMARFDVV